jgi:hypothetical protein
MESDFKQRWVLLLLFICDFFRLLKRSFFEQFHFKSPEQKKILKKIVVVGVFIFTQSTQSFIFTLKTQLVGTKNVIPTLVEN